MQEIKNYLQSKKNLVSLITLVFLLLAIPLGIYLATRVQIFFPKAVEGIISLAEGNCVTTINGEKVLTCGEVPLKLIMPFGSPSPSPSGSSSPSPSPSVSPSPSASASASPAACNPKKFDQNTWSKTVEICKKKKQRVVYSCEKKTKTRKQKCDPVTPNSSPIPQSAFNGPHNIPGKIEAEDFDNGGEDVAYHDTKVKGKQSRPYRDGEHVDIAHTNDPSDKKGFDVSDAQVGEWLEYTAEVLQAGSYIIESRVNGSSGGVFHIEIDGVDKSGPLTIPAAKSGKDWSIVKSPAIDLTEGQIIIRVVMDDGKGDNIVGGFNYFEFKNAPTANLMQKIQKALINSVFAGSDEDDDRRDSDPKDNSEASKSAKTKCTKKMKKKGLCPVGTEQNCADKKDNDGDGKIDKDDPECHTDGDPDNKKSYDRKRNEAPLTECKDGKDNDSDGLIDSADPGCHKDLNAQNIASYDPDIDDENRQASPKPSPDEPLVDLGIFYRLAETEAGLASATFTAFTQNPTITTFTLSDETPGTKQIWVEFKNNLTGETVVEHITVNLIDINPRVTGADCTLDINKRNLKVTITGSNFGQNRGKVLNDETGLNILEWKDDLVTGLLENPGISTDDGESFEFELTRSDGVELEDTIFCRVDTSTIALGARVFCRDQGKFDVPNVKVTLKDQNNNTIEEKVTITKEGLVSGLKTKLQSGKQYILSIKAPNSLRRNAIFTAGVGTTFVSQSNGQPFILPVGDIAPPILPDGKINTLDRSEIVRQWSVLGKGTDDTGDFNKDKRINSIDWACMRYDFNQEDEVIPDASTLIPSPTPTPTPLPSSTSLTSPSPSPAASSQRAAYFLPEAEGGGTYAVNSEFGVSVNLWSQNEAANLFSAQLSFNPQVLEVVRVEKGSALTNWTSDSFDNSTGKVSLIAGIPSPGLKTVEGTNPLMAKIIFKGKLAGSTTITMGAESAIYSNIDNANIISALISTPVVITQ